VLEDLGGEFSQQAKERSQWAGNFLKREKERWQFNTWMSGLRGKREC